MTPSSRTELLDRHVRTPVAEVVAPDEWMRILSGIPLLHHPGEAWLYNTGGHRPARGPVEHTTRPPRRSR